MEENQYLIRLFCNTPLSVNEMKEVCCEGYKPILIDKKTDVKFELIGPVEVKGVFVTNYINECVCYRNLNTLSVKSGEKKFLDVTIDVT